MPAPLPERPQGRQGSASAKFAHIFSFNGSNGREPAATLIDVNGTLYGTTYAGGANDEGTAFALTASGSQTLLHSFKGGKD
ncbi:MAG TPA: choice-of-anchor tandem repeat GloVer-containing protein, partial [Candidatus Cybelea sp.]